METKQLVTFCAVVERRSFSQAADQLGVTQPAVSLQIRSLEQRLGRQLLDRSGRRVEPTEAGLRLYRGAQRLLALEEQLLQELGEEATGELVGRLEIGASSGPGGSVLPVVLGEFQRLHPQVRVALAVFDTHTVVEQVGSRELELGVVGAAGRHRGVTFEPFYRDEVVLAVPAGHRRAGETLTLEELKAEPLVLMQEGAGIRQMVEDDLRELGVRLRDLDVKLELGLQESARAAVLAGFGATFISRIAIEGDLAAGSLAMARVEGLEPARDVQLVRAAGRAETRVARAFVEYARGRLLPEAGS
jgi:DNA-binding transcriptional LysR family regulator